MSAKHLILENDASHDKFRLPLKTPARGPVAVDVTKLYRDRGLVTYDPGFMSTASCESGITYIDGEQGILEYRGYPIEQLAAPADYLEVAHLLLYGELPDKQQLEVFDNIVTRHSMLNENLKNFFLGFHHDAHPMAIMVGVVGSLSAFYHDSLNIENPRHREISAHRLIAKMPTTFSRQSKNPCVAITSPRRMSGVRCGQSTRIPTGQSIWSSRTKPNRSRC